MRRPPGPRRRRPRAAPRGSASPARAPRSRGCARPTHTSASGTCSSTSSLHTTVVCRPTGRACQEPAAWRADVRQDASACLVLLTWESGSACCPSGPTDSVLDVPGVGLGHATVWRDEAGPAGRARRGPHRSDGPAGRGRRVPAAGPLRAARCSTGPASCTGLTDAGEWRLLETPILLTSTMQLGRVYDAACVLMLEEEPAVGDDVVIPVVGECDDSWLNDVRRMQVTEADVRAAWQAAKDSVGSLLATGRGRGRLGHRDDVPGLQGRHRHGVAGRPVRPHRRCPAHDELRAAAPVAAHGRRRPRRPPARPSPCPAGPTATTARASASSSPTRPLDGASCERLARRVGLGLARTGSVAYHGSGEIFLAAATGLRADRDGQLDGDRRWAAAPSTRSSRPSSRPARRRCSTRCWRGHDDGRSAGPGVSRAAGGRRPRRCWSARAASRRRPRDRSPRGRTPGTATGSTPGCPMADGVRLAVTLYLPDPAAGPQPCILEALPYRKDDLTLVVRAGVRAAARRVRLRGRAASTCAAPGAAGAGPPTSTPRRSRRDLPRSIDVAGRPGRGAAATVGMYGTSYSGFNSLQMACERPPALKAIIAIYATRRPLHRRRALPRRRRSSGSTCVDYCHYMTPMNALPPVPAVWGDGWREEWLRRHRRARALAVHLDASSQRDGAYWRHGSVRPDYDRIAVPDDGRRRLGRRLPQQLVPDDGAAARATTSRTGCSPARGRTRPTSARCRARASTSCPRWSVVGPVAARRRQRRRPASREAVWYVRGSHRPAPDLDTVPGYWRAEEWPSPRVGHADAEHPRPAAVPGAARRRHRRLDLLRRPPAVRPAAGPAPRRRRLADVGLRRRRGRARRPRRSCT